MHLPFMLVGRIIFSVVYCEDPSKLCLGYTYQKMRGSSLFVDGFIQQVGANGWIAKIAVV